MSSDGDEWRCEEARKEFLDKRIRSKGVIRARRNHEISKFMRSLTRNGAWKRKSQIPPSFTLLTRMNLENVCFIVCFSVVTWLALLTVFKAQLLFSPVTFSAKPHAFCLCFCRKKIGFIEKYILLVAHQIIFMCH